MKKIEYPWSWYGIKPNGGDRVIHGQRQREQQRLGIRTSWIHDLLMTLKNK